MELIFAPDPIYKTHCTPVHVVDDHVRAALAEMMVIVKEQHALGIAAPMVGLKQQLVAIALEDEQGVFHEYAMVNPTITQRSAETVMSEEGSITFLGVTAVVERATEVTVAYLDAQGQHQTLQASGILAICLQHEIDYLHGKTMLDYQSATKRDMLRRKMEKQKRLGFVPHVHGPNCHHHH